VPAPAQARPSAPQQQPAALRSNAGQPAGAPCATCQQGRPPPNPPCGYDKVEIKCKHCGVYDQREDFQRATFTLDTATGVPSTSLRPSPNRLREFFTDRFEVAGRDKVTLTVSGGPGFHPDHPAMTLTPPAVIGPPRVLRGPTHEVEVDYEPNWFENRLANLDRLGFSAGLRQFFFPRYAAWQLEILACGVRQAPHAFGRFTHTIAVYPKDTFKLSLNLPAVRRTEMASSDDYREGPVRGSSRSVTNTSAYARTSDTTREETRETANSYMYRQTQTSASRHGAVTQTQTLATLHGRDYSGDRYSEGEAPASAGATAVRSFTFTHNGQDWSQSIKAAELIETIVDLRRQIMSLIELFRSLANRMPRIGWTFTVEAELLSGSLEYEWGYKEWKKDHTVFPWYKVEVALTVVSVKFELAYGLEMLGARAQIYGAITGESKLSAAREAEPDGDGPAATLSSGVQIGGELGIRGALGDWVEVVGRINAGFEGKDEIELAPFKLKTKLELSEGKGTFTARSRLLFSVTRNVTMWRKYGLIDRTIIG
jgi:hypothetical protein